MRWWEVIGWEVAAVAERGGARLLAALYGPTSAGKTALAVDVARRVERDLGRRMVVISADSRQVYRHMDMGTSKTIPAEMRGIQHEMIDVAEPARKLELEEYTRLARRHITAAFADQAVPFIVGGTGIYVSALLEGWQVDHVGAARASLRRDFPRSMVGDAYAMLRRLSRDSAAKVHPNNYEAIINALAVLMAAAPPTSQAKRDGPATVVLGIDPGLEALDRRVARTYAEQVRHGLFAEIEDLNARYGLDAEIRRHSRDSPNQVLHTHGYREYFELALERGKPVANLTEQELAEVGSHVVEHVRRHTRRQRGWFDKLPIARFVSSAGQAFSVIAKSLASS